MQELKRKGMFLALKMFACVILFAACSAQPDMTAEQTSASGSKVTQAAVVNIPGKIEAENYDAMSGIQTETCSEGTLDVGWIDAGDWMDYSISVPVSASYQVEFRVAAMSASGKFDFILGSTTLTSVSIPNTGGWQTWTSVYANVNLPAGQNTIRLSVTAPGFNINWFNFTQVITSSSQSNSSVSSASSVSSSAASVSGTVNVNFYNANINVQNNSINPSFRIINNGTATLALSSVKLHYFYTEDGSQAQTFWCDYSTLGSANVNGIFVTMPSPTATADSYLEVSFSASAGGLAPGGSADIQGRFAKNDWSMYNQGNDYSFNATATAFTSWNKVTAYVNGILAFGTEPNGNTISSVSSQPKSSSSSSSSTPASSSQSSSSSSVIISSSSSSSQITGQVIPGKIEAESYNAMSGIQTETCAEGTLDVGWIDAGDWCDYTVNVTLAGSYQIEFRVAGFNTSGAFNLNSNGSLLTSVAVPNTGGWQTWTSVFKTVTLAAGPQTLRVAFTGAGMNFNWFNIQKAVISSSSSTSSYSSSSSSISSSSSSNYGGYTGFIRASGKILVDQNGKEFFIRSICLGNWLEPEGYMWQFSTTNADRPRRIEQLVSNLIGTANNDQFWQNYRNNYITEADISMIAQLGFNAIRLPLNARIVMQDGTGTALIPSGFQYIDNLIAWCKKYGVYVVIDMHCAPGGQTGANIDDCVNDQPELFQNDFYWNKAITLWTAIASRYQNESIVLAYDLLNEPLPSTFSSLNSKLEPFYKACTAAIRTVDTKHLITIEGANWATDWSVFGTPFDSNLMYQFHKYWNNNDQSAIQTYLTFRDTYNVPIWCGESGEDDDNWYRASYGLLEANHVGWALWPWKKMNTTNDPYSISVPNNWYMIQNYAASQAYVDPATALAILNDFLVKCQLANCTYYPDVVSAVFGR